MQEQLEIATLDERPSVYTHFYFYQCVGTTMVYSAIYHEYHVVDLSEDYIHVYTREGRKNLGIWSWNIKRPILERCFNTIVYDHYNCIVCHLEYVDDYDTRHSIFGSSILGDVIDRYQLSMCDLVQCDISHFDDIDSIPDSSIDDIDEYEEQGNTYKLNCKNSKSRCRQTEKKKDILKNRHKRMENIDIEDIVHSCRSIDDFVKLSEEYYPTSTCCEMSVQDMVEHVGEVKSGYIDKIMDYCKTSVGNDIYIKIVLEIVQIVTAVEAITNCNDTYSQIMMAVSYFSSKLKENTKFLHQLTRMLFEEVGYCINEMNSDVELSTTDSGIFDSMKNMSFCTMEEQGAFDSLRSIVRSTTIKHTSVLLSGLATAGFVAAGNFTIGNFTLFRYNCLKESDDGLDFLDRTFEALDYFLDRGWKCFATLSVKPLVYGEDDLTELVNMVSECKSGIVAYKQGNYMRVFGHDPSLFDDLIEKTMAKVKMCKAFYTKGFEAKLVEDQKSKFMRVHEVFVSFKKSMGCRVAPVFVKLFAGSGVGKSSLCSYTSNAILDCMGYMNGPEHTVNLSTIEKYDSNARTNVSCYVLDDMANTKANLAVQNPAELIIRLKNNVPTTANMAEAEDKGKVFFEPKVLVATTNNRALDAPYWSVSAKSVLRRVDIHVVVKARPEHSKDGMLDAVPGKTIDDLWLITIEEPIYRDETFSRWSTLINPIPDTDDKYRLDVGFGKPMVDMSIYDYLRYICWFSKKHFNKQDKVVDHILESRAHLSMCTRCKLPGKCCRCLPVINVDDKENQSVSTALAYNMFLKPMFLDWWTFTKQHASNVWDRVLVGPLEWRFLNAYSTLKLFRMKRSVENPILNCVHSLVPDSIRRKKWYVYTYNYMRRREAHQLAVRCFIGSTCLVFGYAALDMCGFAPVKFTFKDYKRSMIGPIGSYFVMKRVYHARIESELLGRSDVVDSFVEDAKEKFEKSKVDFEEQQWSSVMSATFVGCTAGLIILGLNMVRSYRNGSKDVEQALLSPYDQQDIDARNRYINVWEPTGSANIVGSPVTGEQLCNIIASNTMYMEYTDTKRRGACNCVFVQTGWIVMPYHVWFDSTDGKIDINSSSQSPIMEFTFTRDVVEKGGIIQSCHMFKSHISFNQVLRIEDHDLCLVNAQIGGTFKSIINYFPDNNSSDPTSGACIFQVRTKLGNLFRTPAAYQNSLVTYNRPSGSVTYVGGLSQSKYVFQRGDCCGCYVTNTTRPVIIGFHLLGSPSASFFKGLMSSGAKGQGAYGTLYAGSLKQAMKSYSIKYCVLSNSFDASLYSHSIDVPVKVDMGEHSSTLSLYVKPEKFSIVGACGSPSTYRTEYKPSFMFDDIVSKFGECSFKPPDFKTTNTWAPFEVYLTNINNSMGSLDAVVLSESIRDYVSGFMESIKSPVVKNAVKPLDEVEVINGRVGIRFIDGMNMNSSIGFPFKGAKRKHIIETNNSDGTVTRSFINKSILESISVNEQRYLSGRSGMLVFTACLKDEIIPKFKNGKENTKIRVFTAAGIESQLLIRKYFLPLGMLLSTYPLVSECAVGINSFSPEYAELTTYLRKHGENRIMCGDYSSWDQMLSPQLTMSAFYVLIRLAHLTGNYTQEDLQVMEGIAYDVVYPLVNVNGVLVRLHGSNPSGQNMTSYLNSICNSLLIRCAFFSKYEGKYKAGDFRKYVNNITYGDDIKASISIDVDFGFNFYRDFLSKYNIKFTAADKKDLEVYPDYMNERDASFLKRYTRWIPSLDTYIGVLEEDSIKKSLYFIRRSPVGAHNVITSVFQSALHEVFFMGEDAYNSWLCRINELCDKHRLYFPELHVTFDQRVEIWKKKYKEGYLDEYPYKHQICDDIGVFEEQSYSHFWLPRHWRVGGLNAHIQNNIDMDVFSKHCIHAGCVGVNIQYIQLQGNDNNLQQVSDRQVNSLMLVEHSKTTREWMLSNFVEHSDQKDATMQMEGNNVTQFTTTEHDLQVELPYTRDSTFRVLHTPDVSLSEFLSRPIRVYQATFLLGAGYEVQFNASKIFMQSSRVANRISNYAYISGKMHIKFVINGSPFHYGKIICAYEPLPQYGSKTSPDIQTVQAMMLPYVSCDVSTAEGSILSYDLINPYGAIDLTDLDNPVNIADLIHVHTLGAIRAVGDTNDPINLEAYAWMTDVKLSMPTVVNITGLVEQSEHSMTPATLPTVVGSVGRVMGNMVRKIKPYAVASYDAFGMGLQIAAAFGFSRPSIIPDVRHVQNKPFGNFSHCNVPDSSVKLALDAKNETTIDPSTCGFDAEDELTVVNLGKREFYMSQINWQTTDTARDVLWHAAVTPCVSYSDVEGRICAPSLIAAAPFRYWRGTTYYRVEIVASPFHRGMLRVVFDPISQLNSASFLGDTTDNVHYSHVIDISKDKNYEFCVGMGTPKNYLRTLALPDTEQYGPNGLDLSSGQSRISYPGYIAIQVLLPLTTTVAQGATAVNDVYINVYMHMGDDFEVADPTMGNIQSYTPLADPNAPGRIGGEELVSSISLGPLVDVDNYQEQSKDVGVMDTDGGLVDYAKPVPLCLNMVDEFVDDGRMSSIHFGEKITSLRQIMKRPTLQGVHIQVYPANLARHRISMPSYPNYRGISLVGNPMYGTYNMSRTGPLTWLGPCFLGWRGGIRWKVYTTFDRTDGRIYQDGVSRSNFGYSGFVNNLQTYVGGLSDSSLSAWSNNNGVRYETGASVNQTELCRVHEVEIPYHYLTRFVPHCLYPELVSATNEPELPVNFYVDGLYFFPQIARGFRNIFVSAGDDFGFYFFKYSPYIRSVQLNE